MIGDREGFKAFCRNAPVFGGLEGPTLDRLMAMMDEQRLPNGATVCSEGEQGRTMYVVRAGEVEICRTSSAGNRVPIVRLGVGDCFGEMTLVDVQPRSATVVVTKPAEVLLLTKADLHQLYREDGPAYVILLQNICRELARRLRKADGRIADFLDPKTGGARG